MYLVMKILGEKQTPLRAYKSLDDAYDYMQRYIQDSSHKWESYRYGTNKEKMRKRYYRYLKDNRLEEIHIRYLKLY